VLAFVSHFFDFNHSMAEAQFRKAIELPPPDPVALSGYGDFLTNLHRFEEARSLYVRAQEARPASLEPMTFAANLNYFTGHPDLAIAEYRRVLRIQPTFGFASHFLGRAQLAAGLTDVAVEQLRRSDDFLGRVPFSRADLGYALARTGHRWEAEELLAEMLRKRSGGYYPAFSIAVISVGLDRTDEAVDWLEKAIDERHVGFYFPSIDPFYEPVRTHPRFRKALERMNVPL
jgi:tetratricopeptide (TPR) repeat protein